MEKEKGILLPLLLWLYFNVDDFGVVEQAKRKFRISEPA